MSPRRLPPLALLLGVAVASCGGDGEGADVMAPPFLQQAAGCPPGQLALPSGACLRAGVQENGCAAGETLEDGACQGPGVPTCAAGFQSDRRNGCVAVLPAGACPPGSLAVPGEARCHEVAGCGSAPWGDIPLEPGAQLVDGSYAGTDSDGTADRPWRTVTAAIAAAAPGSLVAIAAGTYAEDIAIAGKPVLLWGRCPSLVSIVGSASSAAAITLQTGSSATELHALGITGASQGIEIHDAQDALLDRVWIHDTAWRGVYVTGLDGPSSVTMRGSLIEGAQRLGVWLEAAATLTIDQSSVRDTQPSADGTFGDGVYVNSGPPKGMIGKLEVTRSLVERNHSTGIFVGGALGSIATTVVRDTYPDGAGQAGRGIQIQENQLNADRASVTIEDSVVEHARESGIYVIASDLVVQGTVVRDISPATPPVRSAGIAALGTPGTSRRADLTLRSSVIERANTAGIHIQASDARVEGVIVRDTEPTIATDGGRSSGIALRNDAILGGRAAATIRSSIIDRNADAGVNVIGGDVVIDGVVVQHTRSADGAGGGVIIANDERSGAVGSGTIRSSLIDANQNSNVAIFGADARIEATIARGGVEAPGGGLGHGISVQSAAGAQLRGTLSLLGSVLDDNTEAALAIISGAAGVESTVVERTRPTAIGLHGDGIVLQADGTPDNTATVRSSLVADNSECGILVSASTLTLESSLITGTKTITPSRLYGDGLVVISEAGPAMATINDTRIMQNARAAVSNFGALVDVSATQLECNAIDLDGESYSGSESRFHDAGGNVCGCGDVSGSCATVSSSLSAPTPISTAPGFDNET